MMLGALVLGSMAAVPLVSAPTASASASDCDPLSGTEAPVAPSPSTSVSDAPSTSVPASTTEPSTTDPTTTEPTTTDPSTTEPTTTEPTTTEPTGCRAVNDKSPTVDTDGDGVVDACDLDSDDDGILDSEEDTDHNGRDFDLYRYGRSDLDDLGGGFISRMSDADRDGIQAVVDTDLVNRGAPDSQAFVGEV